MRHPVVMMQYSALLEGVLVDVSYQSFNKYAQTVLDKTARHAPTGDLPPEIWG